MGAVVIGNIWHIHNNTCQKAQLLRQITHRAITNDEDMYQHSQKFWLERLDGRSPMIKDPRLFVYGFGRRWAWAGLLHTSMLI